MLKAVRKKKIVKNKGTSVRLSADFLTEIFVDQKGMAQYIQSIGEKKKDG